MYKKLKGIVKQKTLMRILHGDLAISNQNAVEVSYLTKEDKVFYATRVSRFFAERKNVRYWSVYQIMGE